MKRKSRAIPLGLTAVLLLALSLFTAQPANAANVTIYGEDLAAVTCNSISAGSDNITIISGSTVTINGNVTMGSNRLIIGAGVGYSNPIPGLEQPSSECPGAKKVTTGISFTGDGSAKLTITGNVTSSSSFDISLVTFETEIQGDITTTGTGKVISNGEFKLRNGTLKLSRNLSAGANVDIIADDDIESEGISSTLGSVKLESTGSIKATAGSGTSGSISAHNEVEIKTTANDKTIEIAGAISSNQGWVIVQTSTGSSGSLIKIDSSITTHGQTIMLLAGGNVKAGDLNIHKDDNTADIRIFANQAGGGSTFIIGGSGNSNGVNGTITNTSDNGSFPGEQTRAVYVSNKNGIQITNGNKIDYRFEDGMGGYENVCVTVAGQGLVLNPARWMGTFSNRIVLRTIEPGLYVGGLPPLPPLWAELYAQAFAYRAVGNLGARPMKDKVFDNGASSYFVCTKAWADAALSGQANGPTVPPTTQSGACNVYP